LSTAGPSICRDQYGKVAVFELFAEAHTCAAACPREFDARRLLSVAGLVPFAVSSGGIRCVCAGETNFPEEIFVYFSCKWSYYSVRHLRDVEFLAILAKLGRFTSEVFTVAKAPGKPARKTVKDEKSQFGKDRRRRHHHYLVTVNYADGENFGRVYTDKDKAARFAERQRRSPIVKSARVTQVS
jgi:hypothetical protein